MAIHKAGTKGSLRTFVKDGGKILAVKNYLDDSLINVGACLDIEGNDEGIAWSCSGMSEVQGERVREIRVMEGEDHFYYEVELDTRAPLTLIFRGAQGPDEIEEINRWRDVRDVDAIKAQMPESLDMVSKITSPGEPTERYYFSFWTRFVPDLGLYPVGVVVASGARLAFLGLEGNELEADRWQHSHTNEVTGRPREDLESLALGGWQTSFSVPEPLTAHDFLDAVHKALARAQKSKERIDAASAASVLVV